MLESHRSHHQFWHGVSVFFEAKVVGVVVVERPVKVAEAVTVGFVYLVVAVEASEAERYAHVVKPRLSQIQ